MQIIAKVHVDDKNETDIKDIFLIETFTLNLNRHYPKCGHHDYSK